VCGAVDAANRVDRERLGEWCACDPGGRRFGVCLWTQGRSRHSGAAAAATEPAHHSPPRPPAFTAFSHIDTVLSILRNIHPEHIEEITYHDCFDDSIGKNNSDMSMFIVLKPGIGYENGIGSYVIADKPAAARALAVDSLARFRFRLLGVYDLDTGDPLPDVDVIDSASGVRAKTTATGTVSLFFVPEGPGALRLHRDGFRDTTLSVTISPADTVPLTVLLSRRPRDNGEAASAAGLESRPGRSVRSRSLGTVVSAFASRVPTFRSLRRSHRRAVVQ
jgi:hypothetical protein